MGAPPPGGTHAPAPLELQRAPAVPPRCVDAPLIEPDVPAGRAVGSAGAPAFAAFLDGIQRSVVAWLADGVVPVVHATTAAVVRVRIGRALRTWNDACVVEHCAYAPIRLLRPAVRAALEGAGLPVIDTEGSGDPPRHPLDFVALARAAVERRREVAEEALLGRWCAAETRPIYVDGALRASSGTMRDARPIGVVKSHRTLYVPGDRLADVVGLAVGERSPARRIDARPRATVATWYLRLREGGGADPLDGLVRVEVSSSAFSPAFADEASRWVLAEREPAALPDARWRVLAYGIRDCEEYLRAVAG